MDASEGRLEGALSQLEEQADATLDQYHTALMAAAVHGRLECARLLIEKGAVVNAADKEGHSALAVATNHRQWECVDLLSEKGADLNSADAEGRTAPP
mmetsp:Transcript_24948/g.61298  ORF Transcript_24948/g.61298 Transcript_24948/m.61298 type:complete len:98 (+) Transcript_24948:325-618(+)